MDETPDTAAAPAAPAAVSAAPAAPPEADATSIWDGRYEKGEHVGSQAVIESDPTDYTQHRFLYQHSVGKPMTGALDGWSVDSIAKQFFKHSGLAMAPAGPPPVVNDAGPTANEKLPYLVSNQGNGYPLPINTSMHIIYEA